MTGSRTALINLILLSIGLQLAAASLVKYAILPEKPLAMFVAIAILIVISLNFGRLLIWNFIHKRYPVSMAYPLSALFFPGVVGIAWLMGEPVGVMQAVGGLTVMAGVIMMLYPDQNHGATPTG